MDKNKYVNIQKKEIIDEFIKANKLTIYKSIIGILIFVIIFGLVGLGVYVLWLNEEKVQIESQAIEELTAGQVITKAEIDSSILESITETNGKYTGERVNGKKNGIGKYEWTSGAVYEGEFKDDRVEGKGKLYIPEQGTYEGDFVNNQKNGEGIYTFINGDKYKGSWADDVMAGKGKYTFANGEYYEGEFANNMFNGQGTYVVNSNKYTGTWTNNAYNR